MAENEYTQDPCKILAYSLETLVTYRLKTYECERVSDIIMYYEKHIHKNEIPITDVFNAPIYVWYYGNFLSYLYHIVFQPYLYLKGDRKLSHKQIQDIIHVIYRLVTEYKVDHTTKNYYHINIEEYTEWVFGVTSFEENNVTPTQYKTLLFLAKHGQNVLTIQRDILRIKLARMHKKKKDAVRKIENWWFEIVNSPYTRPGSTMLTRRAQRFHTIAYS